MIGLEAQPYLYPHPFPTPAPSPPTMSYIHARRQIRLQGLAAHKWKAQKKLKTGDTLGVARVCSTMPPSPLSSVQMIITGTSSPGPLVRPSSPSAQAAPSSEIDDADSLIRTANSDESVDSLSGLLVTKPNHRLDSAAHTIASSSASGRHGKSGRRL